MPKQKFRNKKTVMPKQKFRNKKTVMPKQKFQNILIIWHSRAKPEKVLQESNLGLDLWRLNLV
jgi:hypothetical protein